MHKFSCCRDHHFDLKASSTKFMFKKIIRRFSDQWQVVVNGEEVIVDGHKNLLSLQLMNSGRTRYASGHTVYCKFE